MRGTGAVGACHGDSGGPLACPLSDGSDSVLVGSSSFVIEPCASGSYADGYVGVSHHLDIYNGAARAYTLGVRSTD